MVKDILRKIIFVFGVIFLLSFVSASFTSGKLNHSIDKSYGPNNYISGWINLSFSNEPANSILKSSFEDSITLFDLITKDSNLDFIYTCSPIDCNSDYTYDNEESSKSLSLDEKDSTLAGFKITEKELVEEISSFSMKIISNNLSESENLPLSVDVFNDGQIDWQASSASGNFNSKKQGCYVSENNLETAKIITTKYCEKINLPQAPSVAIGANVIGSGSVSFTMSIEEADGGSKETCIATASQTGEIKCSPSDFSIEGGDYFVCIKTTKSSDANKYSLEYEQKNPCGFSDDNYEEYSYDFNIFAQAGMYSQIGEVSLEDLGIEGDIMTYLSERYNYNCSKDCIIPIKFISGVSQKLDLTEPSLIYTAGVSQEESVLYDLEEIPAKISSKFQKLDLDEAGFSVPEDYGNYTFSLQFDGNNLFSEKITVEKTPAIRYLTPTTMPVGYSTNFKIHTNWSSDIEKYEWDFGDGTNETTTTYEVSHTYEVEGDYVIKVKITDEKGITSSRTFGIDVLSVSEFVPLILNETQINIEHIKKQLNNFSEFERESFIYSFKMSELEDLLSNFSYSLSESTLTEEEYGIMIEQLMTMGIPESIDKTASGNILFYPQLDNIDLTILSGITEEEYPEGNEDDYKYAILAWEEENLDTTINYGEISTEDNGYIEPLLNLFNITFTKKETNLEENYIVIRNMENLFFDKDYSQVEMEGYYYIPLSESKEIVFSTTEDINFETLPMFIAPKISELTLVNEQITDFETSSRKWIIFGIIAGSIILSGIGLWLVIRLWYRRRYENYLFKNRNNLLNLVSYIDGEKKKGTTEREILEKLKKAGWNSEQIKYSLKKYSGKKII